VALHYLAGLPYAEAAALTGSSADAVRRAASDGIAKLRARHGALDNSTEGALR
jgi:DNA-directed RNA polymerase specialized sigma24 family protein